MSNKINIIKHQTDKLTKSERNKCYRHVLALIIITNDHVCPWLHYSTNKLYPTKIFTINTPLVVKEIFPEFYYYKNYNDDNVSWFKTKTERINALKNCIKQTNPKTK